MFLNIFSFIFNCSKERNIQMPGTNISDILHLENISGNSIYEYMDAWKHMRLFRMAHACVHASAVLRKSDFRHQNSKRFFSLPFRSRETETREVAQSLNRFPGWSLSRSTLTPHTMPSCASSPPVYFLSHVFPPTDKTLDFNIKNCIQRNSLFLKRR